MLDRFMLLLLLVFVGSGCNSFSGGEGSEIVLEPTQVGTPVGDKITKEIGPAGGVLASADGRLTVTVPPNAVTETTSFSIQPISNTASNGIGDGYRLEPDGKTFAVPLEIAARYDDRDLKGTVAEALAVAYQDSNGAWHVIEPLRLTNDTLTITTTHFTAFSVLARLKVSPEEATVRVGETIEIKVVGCLPPQKVWLDDVFPLFASEETKEKKRKSATQWCHLGSELAPMQLNWITDKGTLGPNQNPVSYTAPARKPSPNVATVAIPYATYGLGFYLGVGKTGLLVSRITIVDRGYRAAGRDGPVSYSGVICSLEKPFEVTGKHPLFTFPFKFIPTSGTGGTMAYQTSWSGTMATGGGPYKIEGLDTDVPRIVIESRSSHLSQVGTTAGGGKATILLAPLAANEDWCDE